jgi:uncharacterized membrane protein
MIISSPLVHRVPLFLAFLDLMLLVSLFLAPISQPEGSVTDLDANANWVDHSDRWDEMEILPRIVYYFGDLNCHQIMERTLIIRGNQMPVCSRDVSIFTGILFGTILMTRATAHDHPAVIFTSILPRWARKGLLKKHPGFVFAFSIILLLTPTAIDGGIQALSTMSMLPFGLEYESTNPTRILTGFPMGAGLGMLVASMLMSLFSRRDDGTSNLIGYLVKD